MLEVGERIERVLAGLGGACAALLLTLACIEAPWTPSPTPQDPPRASQLGLALARSAIVQIQRLELLAAHGSSRVQAVASLDLAQLRRGAAPQGAPAQAALALALSGG